jgi:hypothetical protein
MLNDPRKASIKSLVLRRACAWDVTRRVPSYPTPDHGVPAMVGVRGAHIKPAADSLRTDVNGVIKRRHLHVA